MKIGPRISNAPKLSAECWCRSEVLKVDRDIIRSGRTESCGRKRCNEFVFRRAYGK